MAQQTDDTQVEQEKQDQVLQREGFEEELMQQDRSDEAAAIADVETGEESGLLLLGDDVRRSTGRRNRRRRAPLPS